MLELYLLNQFVTVAESKTMTAASEKLFITQSALSRSMKKLEEEFDAELFEHGKNKITLTETGLYALQKSKELLHQAEETKLLVKEYYEKLFTINIGLCSPFIDSKNLLPKLTQKFPNRKIVTEVKPEKILLENLKSKKYDIIIFSQKVEDSGLYCNPFFTEKLFATVNNNDMLYKKEKITFEELNEKPLLLLPEDGYWNDFLRRKFPLNHLIQQKNIKDYDEILNSGTMISFTTSSVLSYFPLDKKRKALEITGEEAQIQYCYICRSEDSKKFADCFMS